MNRTRRVLCVTGDPDAESAVRDALETVAPGAAIHVHSDPDLGDVEEYAAVVVTDLAASDPLAVVTDIHGLAPGVPVLVAASDGSETLASDAAAAGAVAYTPLHDADRLASRIRDAFDDGPVSRFYDHLVENVGVGVGAYGRNGRITYANSAYAALLDRSRDDLLGSLVWDVNPAVDADRFTRYFDSFAPGETRHADTSHRVADGRVVPVHTVTTRIDVGENPLHVGTIMDTTQRVNTQRKIEALHDVANALAEPKTADAVHELTVDAAERILDLHACYFIAHRGDRFDVTASSAAAPVEDHVIPEGKGVLWQTYANREPRLVRDIPSDPHAEPSEDTFRSALSVPVGSHGVFQAVSTEPDAFTDEDLELAVLLATHAAAALDRVQFEATLRSERDRLSALFENVPNPAVAYEFHNGNMIATEVNPAFEAVFGYDADEFVGRDIDEAIVPPDELKRGQSFNEDLVAGRNVTAEVERVTADGPRDFLLDVVPLEVDAENAAGYAIYTDITEQKQRERQLARQNDRLDEFASVVSHDLRNPLNVATGRLDLAAEAASGDTADHVAAASEALSRMDALIADLLTLAREGRSLGDTHTIDLGDVARNAWASVETADAKLVIDDPPNLQADPDRVRQLLENLFRNAIEHSATTHRSAAHADAAHADAADADGPSVTVTVSGVDGGFAVSDDGPGIAPDIRNRIFTSGFTTSADGTGFGLSIVERIASAHGWTVDVDASDAGGAQFIVRCPDIE